MSFDIDELKNVIEKVAMLEKDEPKAIITAEDAQLVTSQIKAALALVKSLREYLEQAGKLQASERNRFKAAETALQAIRVKPTNGRAAMFMERLSQAKRGKLK